MTTASPHPACQTAAIRPTLLQNENTANSRGPSAVGNAQLAIPAMERADAASTDRAVLRRVRGDVLEGPLQVLVVGQLAGEGSALRTAEPQQAVVGGQRAPVEQHHLVVVVVGAGRRARGQAGQSCTLFSAGIMARV